MPFIDANTRPLDDGATFDVTIIGAGAAGIMLAVLLSRRQKRVLVIETGHFELDDDRQSLNEIEQTAKTMSNAVWNRKRAIGGTTTAWGGQSLPFSALDFAKRDWVKHSGWPISAETLQPYYDAANRFMGIDEHNYDTDILGLLGRRDPGFDPRLLHYHYSKWAREPNFYKLHRRALQNDVTVLYNAHLQRIDLADSGRVQAIEISNFSGRRQTMPIDTLVLASGGIETNRILLLNDHQVPGGLGSASGWLGRAFMEHPCLEAGYVDSTDMPRLQEAFGTRLRRGRRYSVRLSAGPDWQRANRLLNISASLMWLYDGDEVGPLTELKLFIREPRLGGAMKIARGGGQLASGLWTVLRSGLIYKPGASAKIALTCEQQPSRDSYIALSDQRDRFGARMARLHWQIGRLTWDTAVRYCQTMADEMARLGLGQVRLLDELRADVTDFEDRVKDVNHHMGGARMSASPADGVVNDQLQLWGVPNLYVCSAAVFPTSSHSNPTLTLLALAARLVDRLSP